MYINHQKVYVLACLASVSVLFPSKDRAKNGASKRGVHFSRGQNRESRSSVFLMLRNSTETLATQAIYVSSSIVFNHLFVDSETIETVCTIG